MYRVDKGSTIASLTDLRRRTNELFDRIKCGESVVIQRNTDPGAVLVDPRKHQKLTQTRDQLADLELLVRAVLRDTRLEDREEEMFSHEEMLEFFGVEADETNEVCEEP